MKSTGEVMGVGRSFGEAFNKSQQAAGAFLPESGKVLISVNKADQPHIAPVARRFAEAGFELVATRGTGAVLRDAGLAVALVNKVAEGRPHVVDSIKNGDYDLIINTTAGKQSLADSYTIRREALNHGVTYFTTLAGARAAAEALSSSGDIHVERLQDLHRELV